MSDPAAHNVPHCNVGDWMHDKNLGSDKVCYGSVIHILIHQLMPESPSENCAALMLELSKGYNTLKIDYENRFHAIQLNMISRVGAVKLKGKGGEVRHVVGPLHLAWMKYRGESCIMYRHMHNV